jgi:hypothetical protein
LLLLHLGWKEVTHAYSTHQLGPDMIGDGIDYFSAILSRVHVYAERSLTKWHVDDLNNGISDSNNIFHNPFSILAHI